jgi:hypothetical protein
MGGGTTIVEAATAGRQAVGCDLNELAFFISKVKTIILKPGQRTVLAKWANSVVPNISYPDHDDRLADVACAKRTQNLSLPMARAIKKFLGLALCSVEDLPGKETQDFARCAMLNAGQWALNGRKRSTVLAEFRIRLRRIVHEMLAAERAYSDVAASGFEPSLHCANSADISSLPFFRAGRRADIVVTSPPYPGIHMLYHRWQVDGRRETPAPYWIADCNDGQGASFYNFADRRRGAADTYFSESLRTLQGIRSVVRDGAIFVQMIAFSDPNRQLPRYLANMEKAAFSEVRLD